MDANVQGNCLGAVAFPVALALWLGWMYCVHARYLCMRMWSQKVDKDYFLRHNKKIYDELEGRIEGKLVLEA